MSIASEITRLQTAKANLKTSIENKGVTVPSNATLDSYSGYVDSISSGGSTINMADLPTLRLGNSTFTTIPYNINFTGVTNFENMFNASKLQSIAQGDIDTSSATNFSNCFTNCQSLSSIAGLDTSSVTNFFSCFSLCAFTVAPNLDTSKATNVMGAFSFCTSMTTMPEYDFSSATLLQDVISSSTALVNMGGFKDLGKAFSTSVPANYGNYTLNLSGSAWDPNTRIGHDALVNVINKVYDIATKGCNTQKIELNSTLIGKLSSSEIAVATNKGWTVSS